MPAPPCPLELPALSSYVRWTMPFLHVHCSYTLCMQSSCQHRISSYANESAKRLNSHQSPW
jgi:hypothetical protein